MVPEDQLKLTALRFFNEWKERGKEIEKLQSLLAQSISENEAGKARAASSQLVELLNVPYTQKLAEEICAKLTEKGIAAVIVTSDGFIVAAAPSAGGKNALELLKSHGGKGGGSPAFARGKIEKK
jgi:alanyl-tRNA synthetase